MTWRPERRSVAAWASYDLANTVFALGVAGLYFPEWLIDIEGYRDRDLAFAINAAMIIIIILAPWLGARSDHRGTRRPYLIGATFVSVTATMFIGGTGPGPSLAFFSLALVGFHVGSLFYDALLVDVSTESNRGRISGIGVGVGYLGSFVAVIAGRLLIDEYGHPFVFRVLAGLFLLFALPAFFFVRERPRTPRPGPAPSVDQSLAQVRRSWREAARYDGVVPFLVGRFFYSDAINTVIGGFLTIFAIEEVGFTRDELEVALGFGILASVFGGLAGGRLTERIGPRRALHGALYLWMVAWLFGLAAAATDAKPLGAVLVVMGGLALGTTWSADRTYMARITPPHRYAEFYGLYATVGRFATILGPLIWALIVDYAGWGRTTAMIALFGFLVIARLVLGRVDDTERVWATSS
ncbi:MAG: MFS transporter [Acidimicrobiia bacterium]|nr:MFS transporter [Acidimicrobiia bacterium]NNF09668.1 MFS transporter [Acidimicrobiia bacterium]NNL68765.1 MFS transporter [Acidimicrobiia bacterium]